MPNDTALSLLDFTLEELRDWLVRQGHPAFRAAQIYQWIYQKGAASFAEMSNLPEALRGGLARLCSIDTLPVIARREDPRDQTWKYLFQLPDGECVEAVLMPRYAGSVRTDPATGECGPENPAVWKATPSASPRRWDVCSPAGFAPRGNWA